MKRLRKYGLGLVGRGGWPGRLAMVMTVIAAACALWATGAIAVFPNDSVTHFAGCLNTNGSPGGTFVNVAVGETPSKPCGSGQVVVHLSGGDITSVNPDTGLTGGSTNGAASLGLGTAYQLPQGCTNDFLPKWVVSSSTWRCAADDNGGGTITGVTAGTGLSGGGTSGSVALALASGYQLPQGCANGQVAKSGGSSTWSCANDANTQSSAAAAFGTAPCCGTDGTEVIVTTLNLSDFGNYIIIASQGIGGSVGAFVDCNLYVNGNIADATEEAAPGAATEVTAQNVGSPGKIEVGCRNPDGDRGGTGVENGRIVALKVSTLTSQNGA